MTLDGWLLFTISNARGVHALAEIHQARDTGLMFGFLWMAGNKLN
jgi:hypothetical protein